MAPAKILQKLAQVRLHERCLRFVWGTARVLAVALALLACCCFADWLLDRWYDTPRWLLALSLAVQCVLSVTLAVVLVVLPTFQSLPDSLVATWIERAFPDFHHRLVTAVELNHAGATTAGMSRVLIARVTEEAEQKTTTTSFGPAVDSRRLLWSAAVLLPLVALLAMPVVFARQTVNELVGRQLLMPLDITRSVQFELQDITSLPPDNLINRDEPRIPHHEINEPAVCASGDAVAVRFKASGAINETLAGTLRIYPDGSPSEDHPLLWERATDDGHAIYLAQIPASSVSFHYKAWLGDARMRQQGQVKFEARPTVQNQQVTVLLPAYCGLRPDGTRFEEHADTKGEVLGLSGSTAVVNVHGSKPLKRALIELLGPSQGGAPEQVLASKEMTLSADGLEATGRFDLDPRQTTYRILLWDEFGFANHVIPRRGIAQLPDEPPQVALLPEDDETAGAPIILGKRLPVSYRAASPAGLSSAHFCYRIIRNEGEVPKDFVTLPLTEYAGSAEVGKFELSRGLFEKIRDNDYQARVEFHALPELKKPGEVPDRREGGGRVIFETAKIPELKLGDRVEYYVEVLDNRPATDAHPAHLAGQSEARVKEIVNVEQFTAWIAQRVREQQLLSELEMKQRGVFEGRAPTPEE